jgi:hypothetical protein
MTAGMPRLKPNAKHKLQISNKFQEGNYNKPLGNSPTGQSRDILKKNH